MTENASETLEKYRADGLKERKVTREILIAALLDVDSQGLEGQSLAYFIGRLDEIDASSEHPTAEME